MGHCFRVEPRRSSQILAREPRQLRHCRVLPGSRAKNLTASERQIPSPSPPGDLSYLPPAAAPGFGSTGPPDADPAGPPYGCRQHADRHRRTAALRDAGVDARLVIAMRAAAPGLNARGTGLPIDSVSSRSAVAGSSVGIGNSTTRDAFGLAASNRWRVAHRPWCLPAPLR